MPRLIQQWAERPGALDQSNLARFVVTLMSAESCRKIVVACEQAGFLQRERTRAGATVVISSGIMEAIFARYVRSFVTRSRATPSRRNGMTARFENSSQVSAPTCQRWQQTKRPGHR